MSRLTLRVVRAVKNCSAEECDLIAHIQSFDKKPEPISQIIDAVTKRRGRPRKNYETRELTAG